MTTSLLNILQILLRESSSYSSSDSYSDSGTADDEYEYDDEHDSPS